MLYYYSNREYFDCQVNINLLLSNLDKNKLVYSFIDGIENYIEDWKRAILKVYTKEKNKYFIFSKGDYFREPIFIGDSEIRIHFNINKALKLAENYSIQQIPIDFFTANIDKQGTIRYDICSGDKLSKYDYANCNIPVVVIPYLSNGIPYLIIDGNHRITAKSKESIKMVNAVVLTVEDTLSLISSGFEKSIYLFLIEGFDLPKYVHKSASKFIIQIP